MSGRHSGLAARVKEVIPFCTWTHCIIHREALTSKDMPKELSSVMEFIVKVVNMLKHRALNSRLFASLCLDMGSE